MVSLCKEIVAIAGIRIANTLVGVTPTNRTDSIKQALSINITERHLLQVVSLREVVARQYLWLHGTAIAIYFHLINICEASLSDQVARQLVDAC